MSPVVMLGYLQSGPLKLVLVAVVAWLGLFTLFISSGVFLRGNDLQHPLGVIPNGTLEQRTFSVAALKSFPLSPSNQRLLLTLNPSSYINLSFDTTNPRKGPTINGLAPGRAYSYHLNATIPIPIYTLVPAPWDAFGVRPADAVQLNDLVYARRRWQVELMPKLAVYAWPAERTHEHQTIRLSLMDKYTSGDEFAAVVRTQTPDLPDVWSITFSPGARLSVASRALPVQRTLALFLWPVLFHVMLGEGGMAGVVLLWVCLMTAGYACVTVMVAQWVVRSGREGEELRGQGAALRWEEEGWAVMNAAGEEPAVLRVEERRGHEDDGALLLKDQV